LEHFTSLHGASFLVNQLAAGFSTWSITMAATTPNAVSLGWRIIAALS
jgi:hypothetical protein